ncbi:uncharacterized protein CMU_021420 [Cryptosporidium muris RN66]|uniref:Uncharacterized protein n=1 Tax=Cryptosporidium muris (strain RN66) TaxID=441375 RepID=B6AJI7_CRYMR|nr:uncharacterized protein CMU_021420 [Cryptosporidium muris RN66]EEA08378.1 hypothetical protein, conserved [Cryptosporidium muris RN66]|eukprot:XP_002142727.1 hypothetical protein [Cryptosporidium muris RN66]
MSEGESSQLSTVLGRIETFLISKEEGDFSVPNLISTSLGYSKPIYNRTVEILGNGKNAIMENVEWVPYHRSYITTEEAVDIASSTIEEVGNNESNFTEKYKEKLKANRVIFSYPRLKKGSISTFFTYATNKIRELPILSHIFNLTTWGLESIKNIEPTIVERSTEAYNYTRKLWIDLRLYADQLILYIREYGLFFIDKCGSIVVGIKSDPFGYPKKVLGSILNMAKYGTDKIFGCEKREFLTSKVQSGIDLLKNFGTSYWGKITSKTQ